MRKIILFLLIALVSSVGYGQQDPQVSHNMYNNMSINPGYAGSNGSLLPANCNHIGATLIARQQWMGFTSEKIGNAFPRTNVLSIDASLKRIKSGIGITIFTDKLGLEDNSGIKLAYALQLKNVLNGNLGIGVSAGFLNKKIDFDKVITIDPDDPLTSGVTGKKGNMLTDISFGLYYRATSDNFYIGLSGTQLLEANTGIEKLTYTNKRHAYLSTGGRINNITTNLDLRPSLLVKTDLNKFQIDANCLLEYNKLVWGGVSYRTSDAIVILVGTYIWGCEIGYSYDITTSALGGKGGSNGSHEIMLHRNFKICKPFKAESIQNPRFGR